METKTSVPKARKTVDGETVHQFTETITEVKKCNGGYDIVTDKKTGFIIQTQYTDAFPNIGDIITFHTILLSTVVGLELNGKLLYFLSEKDL